MQVQVSDNASGADNQQERLSVESIPISIGNFLSGFALGEASFMLVCRPRSDYSRKWKISAAFNVSQHDITPLELFRETLNCGTIRKAGSDGWYFEVNRLSEIQEVIIPFFTRFPVVGRKAQDFALFKSAVEILSQGVMSDTNYTKVLTLREQMNNGGKRKYSKERILRDYTPNSSVEEMI
jgi:LAGLIDADG endonuclease